MVLNKRVDLNNREMGKITQCNEIHAKQEFGIF